MESKQKIMYLNPVGFASYDAFFAKMISENKFSNTEIHVTSLSPNVGLMENLKYGTYNALIASDLIKATRQASKEGFDAIIIGCFHDPFLLESKEISGDMLVIAPYQSSIEVALKLSNKFSVIIGQKKWEHEMHTTIKEYGYADSLASFRNVSMSVSEFQKDHIITLEFGFYKTIQEKLKIPVIDPSIAALKQAEQAAMLKNKYNWKPSRKWSCEAPSEEDLNKFNLFTKDYELGNRIIIN
jgi:allantoin racemase